MLLICIILILIITTCPINSAENDTILVSDSSDNLLANAPVDDLNTSIKDNSDSFLLGNGEKEALDTADSGSEYSKKDLSPNSEILQSGFLENINEITYNNKYYLFRGDCWTINNNFESSAAVTSESYSDLAVTGTFRTENDIVGLYWNSNDPIQHPYISYGNRSDYSDVILEFDYEMTGCMDFSNSILSLTIAANSGEIYFLTMNRFIENNHMTLDFNNLTLLPGNSYLDKNGQPVTVTDEIKLDVTNLKYIMFLLVPSNFANSNGQYTIMENMNYTCKISNITVSNGEICDEQSPLEPHQYRLCEGYDDSYNLNPFRLSKEMRKLGYVEWVDLYVGASYFYEKSGTIGDVISDMNFDNARTEKMVLDKNVPLNRAFRGWLDCYSRELKNNGVENLIISVSMENLQCPQSWRQMDVEGNFAMTGWNPSTFLYSPCNDEVVTYMQSVCEACLDIVVDNGMKPILQMGEFWWWWNEANEPNQQPYFYDDATRNKYYAEFGQNIPEYSSSNIQYDNDTILWLNHQLVKYSDALREVVKSNKYVNGLYMALFFPPSVTDSDRVPQMMRDVNYLQDAYSPDKLDILQIEDFDWLIFESPHHKDAYTIGLELGFNEDRLHYFAGFVQYPQDADRCWALIQDALDKAIENKFNEVYIWAGLQVRRDNKIIGYDEYVILNNLLLTNQPGIVYPIITAPSYVSINENFTIKMNTDEWVNGVFSIYEYKNGEKGKLLASNNIEDGFSSVVLSSSNIGLNKFYLEFNYTAGGYHLIKEVYIIENSQNISVDVTREIEIGSNANITFRAPESQSKLYITVDENTTNDYTVENGEFTTTISNLATGYHTILLYYNNGSYIDDKLVGEVYYNTFTVKMGVKTNIDVNNINTSYDLNEILVVNLKDSKGNSLTGKEILIRLDGITHTLTTNNNGQVTLPINLLPENYTAEVFYAGDDVYLSASANANVLINKIKTTITANSVSFTYDNPENLTMTLKDYKNNVLANKNVQITLDGENHTITTNNNGQATLAIDTLPGNHTAEIKYGGDNIYSSSSANASIAINKIATNLTSNNISFTYNDPNNLIITLKDDKNNVLANKYLQITLGELDFTFKTDYYGKATLIANLLPGNYTAKILFNGDEIYLPTATNAQITINKIKTSITTNNINFTYDDLTSLTVTLKDYKNNTLTNKIITVKINDKNYTLTTNNYGQATLPLDLAPGNYTAEIIYEGDKICQSTTTDTQITINKIKTSITANDIIFTYDNPTNLTTTLKDNKGNPLKEKQITITINETKHTLTTDNNGQTTLPINLLPGTYTAKINYTGNDIYTPSATNATVTINKITTNLNADNISFTYGDLANLLITLKDYKNTVLTNKDIKISLDGENHTLTTNSNGQVTLAIDSLPGNYTAKITFTEDEIYLPTATNIFITISKIDTIITANDISFTYDNPTNLTTTLKDNKGNPLKEKQITITINETKHTLTTDNNGQTTLPINLLPGTYTAKINYTGNDIYTPSATNATVTINKITTNMQTNSIAFIYDEPENLTITLKDYKNNLLANRNIQITLNGENHTITTNNNGEATLPINLLPGIYTAKITFNENEIYLPSSTNADITINKITTNIQTNNITFRYDEPENLTITLKDYKNNILTNKNIQIIIDNKNYNLTTDNNGQLTLAIDLLPGNHTAEINYEEDDIYLPSSANANIIINKIATTITANNIDFTYDNPKNLTATLKDYKNNTLTNKNIQITIDDKNYTITTDNNGLTTLPIDSLPGTYTAKITFTEDEIYLQTTLNTQITINKIKTNIQTNNINFTYDNPKNLTATLKDYKNNTLTNKKITITLDGKDYTLTTNDYGQTTLPIDSLPGNFTAKITFNEDEIYLPSSTNVNITINKIKTNLTANNIGFIYSDSDNLTITLKDCNNNVLAGKDILIGVSLITDSKTDLTYDKTTDDKGEVLIPIDYDAGDYVAIISFKGDEKYVDSSTTSNITISKLTTQIIASDMISNLTKQKDLMASLEDAKGNALSGADLIITLNSNEIIITTDDLGKVNLPLNLDVGNHTANIQFMGNKNYESSNKSVEITILDKISTQLYALNITSTYGETKNLIITLKNEKNEVLINQNVIVNLNNKVYNITTNENGQVKISVNLPANTYLAKITYAGDDIYKSSNYTAKIVVKKATPTITASSKTFKSTVKTKKVTVTLKYKNNAIKNAYVKLTVNKKTYKVKTNSKGIASFNVKLTKKGSYSAVYKFDGNSNFKSTTKSVKIIIK